MRKLLLFFVFSVIGSAQRGNTWRNALPTSWGSLTDGWQVALYSEKQSYRANEPVWLKLAVHNESPNVLTVGYHTSPWMVATFTVTSSSNGRPSSTRIARSHTEQAERRAGSIIVKLVKPGQIIYPRELDLRTLFDLTAGTYTVGAVMQLPVPQSPKTSIPVHSNTVTISTLGQ